MADRRDVNTSQLIIGILIPALYQNILHWYIIYDDRYPSDIRCATFVAINVLNSIVYNCVLGYSVCDMTLIKYNLIILVCMINRYSIKSHLFSDQKI